MITTDCVEFVKALKMALKPTVTTLPVLMMAHITPSAITTTDLDVWTEIEYAGDGEGDFLVPYKKTLDVLNGEKGNLTLELLEDEWVRLTVGGCEFRLKG